MPYPLASRTALDNCNVSFVSYLWFMANPKSLGGAAPARARGTGARLARRTSGNAGVAFGGQRHTGPDTAPGNGDNVPVQTLSVFFLFVEGVRRPVGLVARARGFSWANTEAGCFWRPRRGHEKE